MIRSLWPLALAGLVAGVATAAPKRPVVAGYERFHDGDTAGSAKAGRLLATELGCINCHASADTTLLPRTAAVLSEVGGRVRVGWLRKYLTDPQSAKPGTTMPHVLANDPDAKDKVEALVHLLASTTPVKHDRPKAIASGRDLYSKVGCVACHGTRDAKGQQEKTVPSSVPLGDLPLKYTMPGLTRFLQDPLHARPSGRMPRLLDAKQANDVASYLLQGQKFGVQGGTGTTAYRYYEGSWDRLPDFGKLKPAAEAIAAGFDLGVAGRGSNYAIVFEGYFEVKKPGRFNFSTTSDDGSKLYVNDRLVVDNDGTHAPQSRSGNIELKPGIHKVQVQFFQGGGGAELRVQVNGPGLRRPLGEVVSASKEGVGKPIQVKGAEGDEINIDPSLVAKGREVFASAGCASCHTLSLKGTEVKSTLKAPSLEKLAAGKGCLSEKPGRGVPHYPIDEPQRKALTAAAKGLPTVKGPKDVIAETMTVFNCYACHSRDKVGGPLEELNKFFQTVQPEMGDEGRVPPPLDGAGAKLQADYVRDLLNKGAHHRPYMHTRMPGFGAANAGQIVAAFEALDRLPAVGEVTFKEPIGKVKSQARHLVGGQAMGCIKCHTFNGKQAEGVQGIDMTLMPTRLKRDWFHAYVTDPQAIRPGTRMPAAFLKGKSVLPDYLDGTALQQVEAMWLYLKDGGSAQLPAGVGGGKYIPLNPTTTAILYRNFIEGAGARAVGVGYPEKAHLAFDANGLRIALLWQGDFMNAGRHWTDRGVGYEPPAGDNILRLHGGVPFAKLASAEAAWPADDVRKLGWRFKGYELDKLDRPTFQYTLGDLAVADFPAPVVKGKELAMKRVFTLTAPAGTDDLTYRAAVANRIEPAGDGAFKVDGAWTIRAPLARIRKAGGKDELLVPVTFKDGKATFTIEYVW